MKKSFLLLFIILPFFILNAQQSLNGDWYGNISVAGMELTIKTSFTEESGGWKGTIDIPEQSAFGLSLSSIKYNHPKLEFVLEVPNAPAKFSGEFKDGNIGGRFLQSGMEGTFKLSRTEPEQETKDTVKLPYNEEEVTFKNDGITFAGTLTLPPYAGKHPAVVMITGSGPQDRDENIYGFRIFGIIADHLTRNGIAVLRYDDRGVGGTTKEKSVSESTTGDFSGDVIEAVRYLRTRKDINGQSIGLIGHSEGGMVAPLVASRFPDEIAFIVCLAGTGVNGEEILLEQTKLITLLDSAEKDNVDEILLMLGKTIDAVKADKGFDGLKEEMRKQYAPEYDKLSDEMKSLYPDKDKWIESQIERNIMVFSSPWMKYFITYDPVPALEKTKCPVLLIFGGLDVQVPPHQNAEQMEKALKKGGNKDHETKIFPNANHLFQEAVTGSPDEYAKLEKKFTEGFLDYISDWILKRFSPSR